MTQLADQGLVSRTSRAGIDCHPLVRGYFGARLKELDGEIFRAAHGRLYDRYRYAGLPAGFRDPVAYALLAEIATLPHIEDQIARVAQQKQWPDSWKASFSPNLVTAPWDKVQKAAALIGGAEWDKALKAFLPDGEEGMTPLFSAVAHGCAAEREAETWSEVYLPRIARGNESFASAKLGLYGQELAALASFFDTPFTKPSRRLAEARQALALNLTVLNLRAIGRVEDAVAPMRAAVSLRVELKDWEKKAEESGALSELLLTLRRLRGNENAAAAGEEAVSFADLSGDALERMLQRTIHANALLQTGALARADALFREAEALASTATPGSLCLNSLQGYRYCELLLARWRAAEADVRGAFAIDLAKRNNWLLDIGLGILIQARAALADAPLGLTAPRDCAKRSAEALAALRRANQENLILCRACSPMPKPCGAAAMRAPLANRCARRKPSPGAAPCRCSWRIRTCWAPAFCSPGAASREPAPIAIKPPPSSKSMATGAAHRSLPCSTPK